MKKQLATVLALLLVLPVILTACGQKDADAREQLSTRPMETMPHIEKETTAPTEAETTAPTEEETVPPTEEKTTAPTEEETNPTILGRVQGNTYTNEYLGIGLELDDSWEFYKAEDLQEIPDQVAEQMAGTEIADIAAGMEQFTDMMAESSEALASINALYQKQNPQTMLLARNMSQEEILDTFMLGEEKDLVIRSYEQMGIEVESMEKVTVDFLGEPAYAIKTVASTQGVPYYILQFLFFDKGEYSVTLTFSSFVEDITEDLAALWYPLD